MTDNGPVDDRGQPLPHFASFRQIYSELQPNEVRTLLLAPGLGDSPIEVQLEVAASTRFQQYEALSYVWGSARPDRSVDCNHLPFRVTESLYAALLHLRYESTWRRLWVDQICIDQTNEDELMSQVTRMGSIYADSSRVVIWLGDMDQAMSKAWKVIEESCLSVSLVRSDFLDSSPVLNEKKVRKPSLTSTPLDCKGGRGVDRNAFRRISNPGRTATRSNTASTSLIRPLRSSLNNSTTSLSSSSSLSSSISSSVSSTSSSQSSQPPRTPIRKGSPGTYFKLKSPRRSSKYSLPQSPASSSPTALQPSRLKLALSVFQHTYFSRLWTFQEIVLSPAAIFLSGDLEFALADLMVWYFHYVSKPMVILSSPSTRQGSATRGETIVYDSIGSFANVMHIRHRIADSDNIAQTFGADTHASSISSHDIKFSTLLMMTRQLDTLKAEDRVLSLLGLHSGFAEYLSKITEIEGWLPVPELFLAAFRYCVDIEQSLDILSAAGMYTGNRREGFEGWPSWLPDWREKYPIRPLVLENMKAVPGDESQGIDESPTTGLHRASVIHQASSRLKMSVVFKEDENGRFTFRIRGSRLGIVLTKPNSWPGRFLVADIQAKAAMKLGSSRSIEHSQRLSQLQMHSKDTFPVSSYADTVLSEAQMHDQICEPLSTSATVEQGDWICILNGGAVLYILRPIAESMGKLSKANSPMPVDTDEDTVPFDMASINRLDAVQCRFIGECAAATCMDGSVADKLFGTQHEEGVLAFELV